MMNIGLIKSELLKSNLLKLENEIYEIILEDVSAFGKTEKLKQDSIIKKILYNHVIGLGRPICICDSGTYNSFDQNNLLNSYVIELLIDYQIGYLYNIEIKKSISLIIQINRETIRDRQLEKILK